MPPSIPAADTAGPGRIDDPAREPQPRVGGRVHAVLWSGVGVVAVTQLAFATSVLGNVPGEIQLYLPFVLYALTVAGAGLLAPRSGSLILPLILWGVGTALLLTMPERPASAVSAAAAITCYLAAWLVIRRMPPGGYALVVVGLALQAGWFLAMESIFPSWVYSTLVPIPLVGATALMVAAVAFAGRLTRSGDIAEPTPPAPLPAVAAAPVGRPVAAADSTNTLAVLALVFGLTGISLGAVICGHLGLAQIRRTGERGHGMAVAGLVLGYLALAVAIGFLVFLAVALSGAGAF
jgi:hypothetical protein